MSDKSTPVMQCERMIPHSNSWGKWKKRCTKPAANTDGMGRHLCVTCSRKHNKKMQRQIDYNRSKQKEV